MNITTVGIDLAKHGFSVYGVDTHGKVGLKKTVSRRKLLECFANLSPCLIGMKAYSGAHHWARTWRSLRHDARIIAPRFVIPYRKSGKHDGIDQRIQAPNRQILAYDREIEALARVSDPARRLMSVLGISAVTATALIASIADTKLFDSGR